VATKIEEIGTKDNGTRVFSAYFGGLAKVDRSFISERLDQLTKANMLRVKQLSVQLNI
jgi:uncharacterized protein YpbB